MVIEVHVGSWGIGGEGGTHSTLIMLLREILPLIPALLMVFNFSYRLGKREVSL